MRAWLNMLQKLRYRFLAERIRRSRPNALACEKNHRNMRCLEVSETRGYIDDGKSPTGR